MPQKRFPDIPGETREERKKRLGRDYSRANAEKNRLKCREWHFSNKEKVSARAAAYRKENLEKLRAYHKQWREANKEKLKAYHSAHVKANLDQYAERNRRREARKVNATPKWANRFFISEAYALAKLRTKMLGVVHHVDHIVPLKNKLVCGLHVEANLQVIPSLENCVKNNRYWPDMPESV